jgi:hypothetical protein
MAKGKYQEWQEPDGLLRLEAWARDGLTDLQIAKNCGISVKTLYEWKNKYSDICAALKKGKEVVDIEVENALFKKTQGYTVRLRKTFKVKFTEYDAQTGRKTAEREELQTGIDEIHIPADTMAMIYWLNNRKPAQWRAKPDADAADKAVKVELGELGGLSE